jgi:hypothetical protein
MQFGYVAQAHPGGQLVAEKSSRVFQRIERSFLLALVAADRYPHRGVLAIRATWTSVTSTASAADRLSKPIISVSSSRTSSEALMCGAHL